MTKQFRITQSFIKSMRAYIEGKGCGTILRAQWIEGRQFDTASEAMLLGCYFEWLLTGAIPKDGKTPEPKYMISAIKKNGGSTTGLGIADMYEPYRQAHANAQMVKEYWGEMGIRPYDTGLKNGIMSSLKLMMGRFEGTLDVVMEIVVEKLVFDSGLTLVKGDLFIMDMKYSGLIDDKWAEMGWMFTDEQLKYHRTQVDQYSWLMLQKLKKLVPFVFMVVSPSGSQVKMFHVETNEEQLNKHIAEGNSLAESLQFLEENDGFEPRPEFNKCQACPMRGECPHRHLYPHPVTIKIA